VELVNDIWSFSMKPLADPNRAVGQSFLKMGRRIQQLEQQVFLHCRLATRSSSLIHFFTPKHSIYF